MDWARIAKKFQKSGESLNSIHNFCLKYIWAMMDIATFVLFVILSLIILLLVTLPFLSKDQLKTEKVSLPTQHSGAAYPSVPPTLHKNQIYNSSAI